MQVKRSLHDLEGVFLSVHWLTCIPQQPSQLSVQMQEASFIIALHILWLRIFHHFVLRVYFKVLFFKLLTFSEMLSDIKTSVMVKSHVTQGIMQLCCLSLPSISSLLPSLDTFTTCTHIQAYAFMQIHMHARTHARTHSHTHTQAHACRLHTHTCTHRHLQAHAFMQVYTHTHTHTQIHAGTCTRTHIYTHTHTHTHTLHEEVQICRLTHTQIHAGTCTHTHTHTHTHVVWGSANLQA